MKLRLLLSTVVTTVALGLTVGAVVPAQAADEASYIVAVPESSIAPVIADLRDLGESPDHVYTKAVDGVAVTLSQSEVATIASENPGAVIIPDEVVSISATQSSATWGISALDQTTYPADSTYTYPDSAGQGVDVFVIDTGVGSVSSSFPGTLDTVRARDFTGIGSWQDCHGHGTHVAGTIASQNYGVAKKATIIPLRVLDCGGSGSLSNVIAAINYAITAKTPGKTAVMNLSLGGGQNSYLDSAVNTAVDNGIVAAVAAGNSNIDACLASPAAATKALTVGALDNSASRAYFSNYGSCVDIYGPGVNILSLTPAGGTTTMSGTSMAAPHAAGVAALYIAQNPSASATTVTNAIVAKGVAPCPTCSPNRALYTPTLLVPEVAPVSVPGAPGTIVPSGIGVTGATVSWTAPTTDGGSAIDSYIVQYKPKSSATWISSTAPSSANSMSLSGLSANTPYAVRVIAHNSAGNSPSSAEGAFTTKSGVPTAPRNLSVTLIGQTATLAWQAPETTNGATLTNYTVEYKRSNQSSWTRAVILSGTASAPPATSTTITKLIRGSSYTFRVTAKTSFGSASATSSSFTVQRR